MVKEYQEPQCEVLLIQDERDIITTSLPNEVGVDFGEIWGATSSTKTGNGGFIG